MTSRRSNTGPCQGATSDFTATPMLCGLHSFKERLVSQGALRLIAAALLAGLGATAAANESTQTTAERASATAKKVEAAVERGAKAAASGVARGAKAAERGVRVGVTAAARGVETGAKAVARTADTVAKKVSGEQ